MNCKRCGHILTNLESIKNGMGKTCARIVELQKIKESGEIDNSLIEKLLNRVRKLELDNAFIKIQLNHKSFVSKSKDSVLDWDIPQEIKEVKDTMKIEFNVIIKELKIVFNSNEPVLRNVRFSDEELGIIHLEEQEIKKVNYLELLKPIVKEVLVVPFMVST